MKHRKEFSKRPFAIGLLLTALTLGSTARAEIYEDYTLYPAGGQFGDKFGTSVAIDNGMIVVGAPFDDENGQDAGAVYVYNSNTASEVYKLMPADGAPGANFGRCVSASNGVIAVGALRDGELGNLAGAAYLYDLATGQQLHKLLAEDGAAGDEFGNAIAIDNGLVAVGAWRDDDLGLDSGSGYLFDAVSGTQITKLLPENGGQYQTFGVSVAVDAGTVAVGSRTFFILGEGFTFAKVHLFDDSGSFQRLLQPTIENYNGDQGGMFAESIAMENGLVVVGAPSRNVASDFSGAAYIFNASSGEQLHFFYPSDLFTRDNFGISVALDGGMAILGADENGGGSVYLFDAASAGEQNMLLISHGATFDRFGASVAKEGDLIVGGATGYSTSGTPTGYVGVFGSDATPAPSPVTDLVIQVDTGQRTLSWTASPNAISYRIERRDSMTGTWNTVGQTSESSWSDNDAPGMALYRVIALN